MSVVQQPRPQQQPHLLTGLSLAPCFAQVAKGKRGQDDPLAGLLTFCMTAVRTSLSRLSFPPSCDAAKHKHTRTRAHTHNTHNTYPHTHTDTHSVSRPKTHGHTQTHTHTHTHTHTQTHTRWDRKNKNRARKAVGETPQELQSSPRRLSVC